MSHEATLPLDDAAIAAFKRDGALCLRGVYDSVQVEALRAAVAWSMENRGAFALNFAGEGAKAPFFADAFVWSRNPDYRPLLLREDVGAAMGRLLDANTVQFYFDHLLVKEPGSAAPTPWHQDAPYWPMTGQQCASMWIALDPVTPETGAVEYVAGSHTWGKYFGPESFKGKQDQRLKNAELETTPDIEARRDEYEILSWDLEPGDVVLHHCMTLHGAPGNETSDRRRRGLALRFIGDDIRYDERPGIPEPMTGYLAELSPSLKIGDRYTGNWFPEIWRA